MLIGSSVNFAGIADPTYIDLLDRYFSCWYPDSGFGWQGEGETAKKAREIIDLAVKKGKQLRGNCLISCTTMRLKSKISKTDVLKHIEQTITKFPEILSWDCVHESLNDDGGFRKNIWESALNTPFWQKEVFNYAHSIMPDLKLFYCDYFRTPQKWSSCFNWISDLLDQNVPIHGISIQLHSNLIPLLDLSLVRYWMEKFRELPILIDIPEIVVWQPAVNLNLAALKGKSALYKEIIRKGFGDLLLGSADVGKLQAIMYARIVSLCQKFNPEMIGFWSPFDAYPWNWIGNRDHPGLWDKEYNRKKSFTFLKESLWQNQV